MADSYHPVRFKQTWLASHDKPNGNVRTAWYWVLALVSCWVGLSQRTNAQMPINFPQNQQVQSSGPNYGRQGIPTTPPNALPPTFPNSEVQPLPTRSTTQYQEKQSKPATTAANNRFFMKGTDISLPIVMDMSFRKTLREIQLYMKTDARQQWRLHSRAAPLQEDFKFIAPADGEYWFTLVTVDRNGQLIATSLAQQPPLAVVVVDRTPPKVFVHGMPRMPEGECVRCEFRDPNLDASLSMFEYQLANQQWLPGLPVSGATNTFCIPTNANYTGLMRLSAVDRSGNKTVRQIHLHDLYKTKQSQHVDAKPLQPTQPVMPPPQHPYPVPQPDNTNFPVVGMPSNQPPFGQQPQQVVQTENPQRQPYPPINDPDLNRIRYSPQRPIQSNTVSKKPFPPVENITGNSIPQSIQPTQPYRKPTAPSSPPPGRPVTVINQSKVALNYRVEDQGVSGVGRVQLWGTLDNGESWQMLAEDKDKSSPLEVYFQSEGLYGLTWVVTNGRGFGGQPPKSGDAPEAFIELDVTPPRLNLLSVQPLQSKQPGLVQIAWQASDKNLDNSPIDLFYSTNPQGPWMIIAKDVANTGQHRWLVPNDAGGHIYLRVTATDRAGNRNEAQTPQPVAIDDLSRPRVVFEGIGRLTN